MTPGRDNGDRSARAMFAAELRAARTRADLPRVVARVTLRFDILRAVALPRDDSRDLLLKVADRWNET